VLQFGPDGPEEASCDGWPLHFDGWRRLKPLTSGDLGLLVVDGEAEFGPVLLAEGA
jgi:hypothetical protein